MINIYDTETKGTRLAEKEPRRTEVSKTSRLFEDPREIARRKFAQTIKEEDLCPRVAASTLASGKEGKPT